MDDGLGPTAFLNLAHDVSNNVAAYLFTNRTVNYPVLYGNMKASIINEAKNSEVNYSNSRPSRRSTDNNIGWFHTEQNVQRKKNLS